ncbi:flavin-containing monooxygenase [Acinetobacter johnsonii]|uniref:flavin-containing monooxygenase n=1 Tax=Acinetobacter johnsonii TaxID=40214 RepID=UPI0021674040|nr:NAD(P)/FAD-dependent oxidoreductase [Acinetobacter johnsonii]MCS3526819.1 cation diffusion facilitator CzcD-associated flavoprotein CzcO [Acinetobacter johnsonii]
MQMEYDVVIIGAGISGLGMGCQLEQKTPNKTYTILERRQDLGGTWDLFRYPGIRSDSDVISFGYEYNPWKTGTVLASGDKIKAYLRETARKYGVEKNIRYGVKIVSANFSTETNKWTISAINEATGEAQVFTCNFLVSATGYYNHDHGYQPKFEGLENFKGQFVHPQHWPENLDYKNKRVVVIGSGATAVTLIPAMAQDTAHITMLQRSPSYMINVNNTDKLFNAARKVFSEELVYKAFRKRNVLKQLGIFILSHKYPKHMRSFLLSRTKKELAGQCDMSHFTPGYMPWEERLCSVPDNDLFKVVRDGQASIVTDHIERFTENGILLKSGKTLEADIIVSATGLELQMMGGIEIAVDQERIHPNQKMTYKGVLLEDVPNFATLFGYTNAPWTLKIDLANDYICKLINELDIRQMAAVTPVAPAGENTGHSIVDGLRAGYVQRGGHQMPLQGKSVEWCVSHIYYSDLKMYALPVESSSLVWTQANQQTKAKAKSKVA